MKTFIKYRYLFLLGILASCGGAEETQDESEFAEEMYFKTVPAEESGIHFANKITESDTFNVLNYQNMYNGGGVALGDINNDGLCDIYLSGNQVSDRLYINKGDLKFEDITETAFGEQLGAEGWHTGVTMADVNQDGMLDIYVCRSGLESFGKLQRNLLFINNGNNTFKEQGAKYGVDIQRGSNQAAFFDMDGDNDLDLYVMNKPYPPWFSKFKDRSDFPYSDVLLENVDGKFVDISASAGIQNDSYGLGIAVTDINQDGFQDLVISNDFDQPDNIYINQGDKTFKDESYRRLSHMSYFSMGNDVADFNNDGFVDIMTVDMANTTHAASKRNMAGMEPKKFWAAVEEGKHFQYMFNCMQLNNGDGTFSEMAQLAGVSKSEWSWAPLFADFDNDGLKDLFISNGYRRDLTNRDYLNKTESSGYDLSDYESVLALAPENMETNHFYKNMGDLKFKKVMTDWKQNKPINSNGAAYADLDNDGDLDMVLNNMETKSCILENKLKSKNNYLKVKCDKNYEGIKVTLKSEGQTFYQELHASRGFQSSVENVLHFGLGDIAIIDELKVEFVDGRVITAENVQVNRLLELNYAEAKGQFKSGKGPRVYLSEEELVDYYHREYIVDDFMLEVLLPHKMSQLGPFISSGDINKDGLEDFYISGPNQFVGSMFLQTPEGKFEKTSGPWEKERALEELGSVMFDIENDGDLDLYVVSGSNERGVLSTYFQDQLYVNDGNGNFTNETLERLPRLLNSGQRPAAGDFDGDGDLDLFIGGRQEPGSYPAPARSVILMNNNGVFADMTSNCPDLFRPGMITESIFDDFDGDGDQDLICVGEWMPISFYENAQGTFTNVTERYNLSNTVGWWMSITAADLNGDGKNDYVLGNIGENNKFQPSEDHPLEVYLNDFDRNGRLDIVLGEYEDGQCYPVRGRQCSSEQMPFIQQKFPTFDGFSTANLDKIYGRSSLDSALHYSATNFSSSVLLSGKDGFTLKRLPSFAQLGPLNATEIVDINGDGNLDIIGVGNNYAAEVETIRYDSGRGVVLLGDGKGGFKALAPFESGMLVREDAKDMIRIGDMIVITSSLAPIKIYRLLNGAPS